MTAFPRRLAAPLLLVLLAAVAAHAAPAGPGPADKRAETPAERVRKALEEVVDVSIDNQPLDAAFVQLGQETKLNFVIDRVTIQNTVGDLNQIPVSLKLSGVKVKTALRTILGGNNLGYAVIGDTVLITTEDMATVRQMRQRVSVDVERQPVERALRQLARETGTNLLLDSRVAKEAQNAVTLQLDDVPLETAVKLLAHMSGLRTVRVGNVLFVTTKETADEMRQDADLATPGATALPAIEEPPVPRRRVVPAP